MTNSYDVHCARRSNPYWDKRNEIRSKPTVVKEIPEALKVGLSPAQLDTLRALWNL